VIDLYLEYRPNGDAQIKSLSIPSINFNYDYDVLKIKYEKKMI